jgi:ketosteroid isomerase-like protein
MRTRFDVEVVLLAATLALSAVVPLAAQEAATEHSAPELSADQQAVWDMEASYWRYVKAGDVDRYVSLWHEDFVGWPCSTWEPVTKKEVSGWVRDIRDNGWALTYTLRPEAVQLIGDLAVVHYGASYVFDYGDGTSEGEGEWRKFTHTWLKVGDSWQIVGGMCADMTPARQPRS